MLSTCAVSGTSLTVMVKVNAVPIQPNELAGVTTYVAVSGLAVVLLSTSLMLLVGPPADPPVTPLARVGAPH